jgi:hypothetical protein
VNEESVAAKINDYVTKKDYRESFWNMKIIKCSHMLLKVG